MDTDSICAALTGAAARLDLHGDVVRSRVALIARQRDAMRWQSAGARVCRARIEGLLQRLLVTSGRLGDAADDLRRCSARLANPP